MFQTFFFKSEQMVLLTLKDCTGNKSITFSKTKYLNSWVSLQIIAKLQMESGACFAPKCLQTDLLPRSHLQKF